MELKVVFELAAPISLRNWIVVDQSNSWNKDLGSCEKIKKGVFVRA
jgi:hypothetical protein